MRSLKFSERIFKSILFFIFTVILSPRSIHSETYYVDINHNSSSDQNPGTISRPWKSIQQAADQILPGDTVLIRGGVYYETVLTKKHGQQDNYLTFMAYPGELPVLDGTGVSESSTGLRIYHDYIRLYAV